MARGHLLPGSAGRDSSQVKCSFVPPFPTTVTDAIKVQCARTPDLVAVESGDMRLTYGELEARADEGALALRATLDPSAHFVGVQMERSVDMVVALAAIIQAGYGYVPLDPDLPAERLRYLIEDSQVAAVLCQADRVSPLPQTATLVIPFSELRPVSPVAHARPVSADTPIYLIYTSGSTGKPKGVVNGHSGVLNHLTWRQRRFPLGHDDLILQKTPLSFDVSAWEIFWPLIAGARLVLAAPGGHRNPGYLKRIISDRGISVIHFVPSMLNSFLGERDLPDHCATLRQVFCSGEALPAATVARFGDLGLRAELHNLYGPTEASIEVSHWECPREYRGPAIPIGKPIAGASLHVLDDEMRRQPNGTAGELYIGGLPVAVGYHNSPRQTSQSFVPDPFADVPGSRLYRTGDRARCLPNGDIEYLGRLDDQVKIYGTRVELGEVESALRAVPGVRDCAVTLQRSDDDYYLVAFVVPESLDGQMCRDALRQTLPRLMVPRIVVAARELPLTPSGKLDRQALVALAPASTGQEAQQEATTLRNTLRGLFAHTLGVPDLRVDDDFFDLGGHSLTAVKLARRISATLGKEVDTLDVFDFPTAEVLADHLADCGMAARSDDGDVT